MDDTGTQVPAPDTPTAPLDERLSAVAALVPDGARVADIGCDHGLLPIGLLESGRVESAIGVDRAAAPLHVARNNARRACVEVELRLGDGLAPLLPGDADCLTLAGIGGSGAISVLIPSELSRLGIRRVVVQVNKKLPLVRRHLFSLGWSCTAESVIRPSTRFFVTCAFDSPETAFGHSETAFGHLETAFGHSETAFGHSETAFGHSETAFGPLDLLVGPLLCHRRGKVEDAYIAHLRRWLETVEANAGKSPPISAGATAAMLRELEDARFSRAE